MVSANVLRARDAICGALRAFAWCAVASSAVAAQGEAVSIEIDVLPGAKRYVELAAYPSYLALALRNNGLSPSDSGLLVIKDGRTLRFKNAELTFVRQDKNVFHYLATAEWSIGVAQTKFEVPVQADLTKIGDGKVVVHAFPPLASFFPDELTDKARLKVQSLAAPAAQKRVLAYLDALPGSTDGPLDKGQMFERILLDAYNLAAVAPGITGGREPGDAEPLADQWMLLATLAIWLVIVPGFFTARAWRRKRRAGTGI